MSLIFRLVFISSSIKTKNDRFDFMNTLRIFLYCSWCENLSVIRREEIFVGHKFDGLSSRHY